MFLTVLNNTMGTRGISKESVKDTVLPRPRATPKDNQKKDLDDSPESWQQSAGPSQQMECNLHLFTAISSHKWGATYISVHILGAPNLMVAKPSSQDTK